MSDELTTVANSISVFKIKRIQDKKVVTLFVIGESHPSDCTGHDSDEKWCVSRDTLMHEFVKETKATVLVEGDIVEGVEWYPISRFRTSLKCLSNPKCLLFDYRTEFANEMVALFLKTKVDSFKEFIMNTIPLIANLDQKITFKNERFSTENIHTLEEYVKQYYWFFMPLIVNHAIFFEQDWVDNYVSVKMQKLFPELATRGVIKEFLHHFLHNKIQSDYERRLKNHKIEVFIVYNRKKLEMLKKYLKKLIDRGSRVEQQDDLKVNMIYTLNRFVDDHVYFLRSFNKYKLKVNTNYKSTNITYTNLAGTRFMHDTLNYYGDVTYDKVATMSFFNIPRDIVLVPLALFYVEIPLTDLICALEILSISLYSKERYIGLLCGEYHAQAVTRLIYECLPVVDNNLSISKVLEILPHNQASEIRLEDELFNLLDMDDRNNLFGM